MGPKTKPKTNSASPKGKAKPKVIVPSSKKAPAKVAVVAAKGAANRAELIDLVKKAEDLWWAAGDAATWSIWPDGHNPSIWCVQLRGIYYGETWSMDYLKEKSPARNFGFNWYSGHLGFPPGDPRPVIGNALFDSLIESAEVFDPKTPVDWGHLICGLDSCFTLTGVYSNALASTPGIAFVTGLEAMTWVGDLGGGAGMLAHRRLTNPAARARTIFDVKHDYGATVNLEGDLAGYLVASDSSKGKLVTPVLSGKNAISKALKEYLNESGAYWKNRARLFLEIYSGSWSGTELTNKADVIQKFADKLRSFGVVYITVRKLGVAQLPELMGHLEKTSREIAEIFVEELIACIKAPTPPMKPTIDPAPGAATANPTAAAVFAAVEAILKKAGLLK